MYGTDIFHIPERQFCQTSNKTVTVGVFSGQDEPVLLDLFLHEILTASLGKDVVYGNLCMCGHKDI